MHETDPLLDQSERGLNFYYDHQKTLAKTAKEQGRKCVVSYPQDVIGFAKNVMNLATALGLYCAASQALTGSELPLPRQQDQLHGL